MSLQLPDSLRLQLKDFERRLCRIETIVTICVIFTGISASFVAVYCSDRIWNTPGWLRLVFLVAGVIPAVLACMWWLRNWVFKRRDVRQLAVLVQRHHRQLGDRLLGVIELADDEADSANVSAELCKAAIRNIAEKAKKINFAEALQKRNLKRLAVSALVGGILVCGLFAMARAAFENALSRWADPFSEKARFTFVQLKPLPKEKVVAHGEGFTVSCEITNVSWWWPPRHLSYVCGDIPKQQIAFTDGKAEIRIPGLTRPTTLRIRAGDAHQNMRIVPVHRSSLTSLTAAVTFPAYLKRDQETRKVVENRLRVPKGGSFELEGKVNRKVVSAVFANGQDHAMTVERNVIASSVVKPAGPMTGQIDWVDEYGLRAAAPYKFDVDIVDDRAPFAECPEMPLYSAMLLEEVLTIKLHGEDDYGLQNLGVSVRVASPEKLDKILMVRDIIVKEGSATEKELNDSFRFSPSVMGIGEKMLVTIKASARDFYPNRSASYSQEHRIYILSRSEHMKLLREAMEGVLNRLEDLTLSEEDALRGKKGLAAMDDKNLTGKKATEKIKEQEAREKAATAELQRLANEGMKLLKEAMRNQNFTDQELKKWAEMFKAMQNIAGNDMKNISGQMGKAGQKGKSGKQRREDLKKAIKDQIEMLKKLQKMVKDMDKSLMDMVVRNITYRLRQLAKQEKQMGGNLQKLLAETVGLSSKDLSKEVHDRIVAETAFHERIRKDAAKVHDDINDFYGRTRIKKYFDVSKDMDKEKVHRQLMKLSMAISDNRAANGMVMSGKMVALFKRWADMLESGDDSKSPSNGGEGKNQIDMALMIALIRALQGEMTLRDRTRVLEKQKRRVEDYPGKAEKLSNDQKAIRDALRDAGKDYSHPQIQKFLKAADRMMREVQVTLGLPETGEPAEKGETAVIEFLSLSMKQNKGNMSQGAMAMMQMMMQMMMVGKTGGGFTGGGPSNMQNVSVTGKDYNRGETERATGHAGGVQPANFPAEYRQAIQNYIDGKLELDKSREGKE